MLEKYYIAHQITDQEAADKYFNALVYLCLEQRNYEITEEEAAHIQRTIICGLASYKDAETQARIDGLYHYDSWTTEDMILSGMNIYAVLHNEPLLTLKEARDEWSS